MKDLPEEITLCKLEVVIMPNGEVISSGKTLGQFRDFKDCLEVVKK